MTLKSEETMLQIADYYSAGDSLNLSARKAGVANRTLHLWLKQSRENDPTCEVEYLGDRMQFARCLSIARGLLYMNMRSNFEARMLSGDREPVYFSGMPTFKPDLAAMAIDDPDVRDMLGYRRDGLYVNERGELEQNVIVRPPPVAGVLAALAMWDPAAWTPSSRVESTVTKTQGATTPPARVGAPVVPPRPKLPELTVLPNPENGSSDDDLLDLLGPVPEPRLDPVVEPELEPAVVSVDPGPKIAEPTPAPYQPTPTTRPLNPQLASLLRR